MVFVIILASDYAQLKKNVRAAIEEDANPNNSADLVSDDVNASDSDSEGSEVIISLSDISLDDDSFNLYDDV
ncbi:hypothetical protein PR048_024773 [Dryococelus australis]|uniref:Uncharacterized protein n=1 Tax=Dryococelus australis TaxID=614101 RepID=A0ABQ9GPH6_9NEOP|nr:hypothetical protein PR048_024773 [Dryococelus australis]